MSEKKNPEQAVLDGSVWAEFCDSLKAAGAVIDREKGPQSTFDRAEGYRYLTRMLRAGLESFLEFSDADFPTLRCGCHETIKMGADNPDNYYMSAKINPSLDYKIIGTRNTVDYLGFSTVNNQYATGGGMETTGFLDSRQLDINPDGSFEIILSQRKQEGNWLPMTAITNAINVRQTFQDRDTEVRADIRIERVGLEGATPEPFTAEKLQRGLQGATRFVQNTTGLFAGWVEGFIEHTNQLPPADQGFCQAIGGDPNIYYFHSNWELAEDECLVITANTIPECQTWNFQLDNWWMESLDYRYHKISVNKHTAQYRDDGSVEIIVAHKDPGKENSNWIDTAGHFLGSMCFRWIGAKEHPPVDCKVLKISDL